MEGNSNCETNRPGTEGLAEMGKSSQQEGKGSKEGSTVGGKGWGWVGWDRAQHRWVPFEEVVGLPADTSGLAGREAHRSDQRNYQHFSEILKARVG